jgi:hypothetical protein
LFSSISLNDFFLPAVVWERAFPTHGCTSFLFSFLFLSFFSETTHSGRNQAAKPGDARTMTLGSASQPWSLAKFAKAQGLPFGAFESGITYYSRVAGASSELSLSMKREWLAQMLDPQLRADAGLALVCWFEIAKVEAGGLYRDFTMFKDPVVAAGMKQELQKYALVQAKT